MDKDDKELKEIEMIGMLQKKLENGEELTEKGKEILSGKESRPIRNGSDLSGVPETEITNESILGSVEIKSTSIITFDEMLKSERFKKDFNWATTKTIGMNTVSVMTACTNLAILEKLGSIEKLLRKLNREYEPGKEPKLCACGCGEMAKSGNNYIHGHYKKDKGK